MVGNAVGKDNGYLIEEGVDEELKVNPHTTVSIIIICLVLRGTKLSTLENIIHGLSCGL